jgi:hypothetical protein
METVKPPRNKGGRPVKPVKKEKIITIRLEKIEHFIVTQKAKKAGLTWSRYVREMAVKGEVKARLTEEERSLARQLVGMSTNLNQLAKGFHEAGHVKTVLHFEHYRNKIDGILKMLRP